MAFQPTQVCELKLRGLLARGEGADVLEAVVDVGDAEAVDLGRGVEAPRERDRGGRRGHHTQLGRHDLKKSHLSIGLEKYEEFRTRQTFITRSNCRHRHFATFIARM